MGIERLQENVSTTKTTMDWRSYRPLHPSKDGVISWKTPCKCHCGCGQLYQVIRKTEQLFDPEILETQQDLIRIFDQ